MLLTPLLLLESLLLLLVRVAPSSSAVAGAPLIAYFCWRPFCYLLLLASILLPTPLRLLESLLLLLVHVAPTVVHLLLLVSFSCLLLLASPLLLRYTSGA